jgi:RecA-family ATPase
MGELRDSELYANKQESKEDKIDCASIISESYIHISQNIKRPPILLSLRQYGNRDVPVMTLSNFSVIKGAKKTRKSFVTAFIQASLAYNKVISNLFVPKQKDAGVVYIDTEQANYDVYTKLSATVNLSGELLQCDNLKAVAFRKYETSLRLMLIEHLIYNSPGVKLFVIDGIRDLIRDINSPDEATMIADKLMKWTADTNCHIIVIIHENKEGGKARGHIGTELTNKAETIIKVKLCEQDKRISIASGEGTRGAPFDDFAFQISQNELGIYPEICDMPESEKLNTDRF